MNRRGRAVPARPLSCAQYVSFKLLLAAAGDAEAVAVASERILIRQNKLVLA
jgi:hypothetical protein